MRFKVRPRRHRVVLRPKVRSQRVRQLAAAGALACLGAAALLTLLQFKREGADWAALQAKLLPPPGRVALEGAPSALKDSLLAFLQARPAAAEVLAAFPCLKNVAVSRSYLRGRLLYEVSARKAFGAASLRGRPAGYLSDDGVVFAAPQGVYEVSSPLLELEGAKEEDLKRLAAFLPETVKTGALTSPLAKMTFVSAADGWDARLADGTVLQWGDLRYTKQKLSRLREILDDARAQFGGAASADMRYFEDGRVLLKPMRGMK